MYPVDKELTIVKTFIKENYLKASLVKEIGRMTIKSLSLDYFALAGFLNYMEQHTFSNNDGYYGKMFIEKAIKYFLLTSVGIETPGSAVINTFHDLMGHVRLRRYYRYWESDKAKDNYIFKRF